MTIKECIDIVDNVKPNQYSVRDKVMWLSFLDETIINEVLKTHEGYDGRYDNFEGYSENDTSVLLIVPAPYDRLYTAYLKMQIDKENGETARYNNSTALYNSYMLEYRKHYNKTHMPLSHDARPGRGVSVKVDVNLTEAEFEAIRRDVYNQLFKDVGEVISPDKLYDTVMSYVLNNAGMLKGDKGDTPQKGIDYFTEKEVADIKEYIKGEVKGADGYSPLVKITPIEGGTRVYITDKNDSKFFDILNGADGNTVTKLSELENDVGFLKGNCGGAYIAYGEDGKSVEIGAPASVAVVSGVTVKIRGRYGTVFDSAVGEIAADFSGKRAINVAAPEEDTDAVNKAYVDSLLGDISSALDAIIAEQEDLIGG